MMRRESAFSNEPQTVGDLMTAPDTDTLIALAREGRIAVVPQWRWRHKNEPSGWRGWQDGRPVVPFSGWNFDIYEWEERLSCVLPTGAPTLTPALLALAEERDRLREALAALVLNIDAGGATLGAMADARRALTAYEAAEIRAIRKT